MILQYIFLLKFWLVLTYIFFIFTVTFFKLILQIYCILMKLFHRKEYVLFAFYSSNYGLTKNQKKLMKLVNLIINGMFSRNFYGTIFYLSVSIFESNFVLIFIKNISYFCINFY